jgi:hypothetical protein
MPEQDLQELLARWQQARNELNKYSAELGFEMKTLEPGKPIEMPAKALTPETIKELDRLQQRVDALWRAYRNAF